MKIKIINLILFCLFTELINAVPRTILVIRHAEQSDILENVKFEKWNFDQSFSLSFNGLQRAYAYVPFFTINHKMTKYGKIVGLFATSPNDQNKSIRSIQTLIPLSKDLNLPIDSSYDLSSLPDMIKMKNYIMKDKKFNDGSVIIVCERENIYELLHDVLNVKTLPFKVWPADIFDWVMVLKFDTKTGDLDKFLKVRQYLMAGDSCSSLFGKKK